VAERHVPSHLTQVGGYVVDAQGNPCVRVGCANCGKGASWMDPITYAAYRNAGRDPAGGCSRACELQIEYGATLHGASD